MSEIFVVFCISLKCSKGCLTSNEKGRAGSVLMQFIDSNLPSVQEVDRILFHRAS